MLVGGPFQGPAAAPQCDSWKRAKRPPKLVTPRAQDVGCDHRVHLAGVRAKDAVAFPIYQRDQRVASRKRPPTSPNTWHLPPLSKRIYRPGAPLGTEGLAGDHGNESGEPGRNLWVATRAGQALLEHPRAVRPRRRPYPPHALSVELTQFAWTRYVPQQSSGDAQARPGNDRSILPWGGSAPARGKVLLRLPALARAGSHVRSTWKSNAAFPSSR